MVIIVLLAIKLKVSPMVIQPMVIIGGRNLALSMLFNKTQSLSLSVRHALFEVTLTHGAFPEMRKNA